MEESKTVQIPTWTLSNGVKMPQIGFGVAALGNGSTFYKVMDCAIETGYRFFDTAPFYENEAEVGDVIRNCGIKREEFFIATKLPNACHAYADTLKAYDDALRHMKLDYIDLFMIHFPVPSVGKYTEAWGAMEKLYREGRVRAIGISNFQEPHIQKILDSCEVVPHTNELECNPYLTVRSLRDFCAAHGIRVINWFPLCGPKDPLVPYPVDNFKVLIEDPVLLRIGSRHNKSSAQVALRWAVQSGLVPIPKSSNPARILQNTQIFDFALTEAEMLEIDSLNHDRRLGPEPDLFDDITMG